MLERRYRSPTPDLDRPEWRVNHPTGTTLFDVSTGSAFGAASTAYALTEMDIVVDMRGNRITLGSPSDLTSWPFVALSDLHPAVAMARAYLPGESRLWELFSSHGGESRFIGKLEAPEQPTEQVRLTSATDVVSQLSFRSSLVSVENATHDAFNRLASEWKRTRNGFSSGVEMFTHPAYQMIIGMGKKVLPLIFEELHRELDHWFWALKAITQVDPVPSEDVGKLAAMRTHWLAWAIDHGYQWQPNFTSTRSIAAHFPR